MSESIDDSAHARRRPGASQVHHEHEPSERNGQPEMVDEPKSDEVVHRNKSAHAQKCKEEKQADVEVAPVVDHCANFSFKAQLLGSEVALFRQQKNKEHGKEAGYDG